MFNRNWKEIHRMKFGVKFYEETFENGVLILYARRGKYKAVWHGIMNTDKLEMDFIRMYHAEIEQVIQDYEYKQE